jgi:hypothetical protein
MDDFGFGFTIHAMAKPRMSPARRKSDEGDFIY